MVVAIDEKQSMLVNEYGWFNDFIYQGPMDVLHKNVDLIEDWKHIFDDIWYIHPFPLDVDVELMKGLFNSNVVKGYFGAQIVNVLPDDFYMEGYLDLKFSPMKRLPKNLIIHGTLDLRSTSFMPTDVPKCTKVRGKIIFGDDHIKRRHYR